MPRLMLTVVFVGLSLCGGRALADSAPPRYSSDALYNLGNSYARAGKPGLAVLNYERAALLAPNDEDIKANLAYVRAAAHVAREPRSRLAQLGETVAPVTAAWLGVSGLVIIGLGLNSSSVGRRFRRLRVICIPLGLALLAVTVSNALTLGPRVNDAVVLVHEAPVRVTPVPMGDTSFALHEAETVTVTAKHEDFMLIRTRDGRSGWVARGDVGLVVPLVDPKTPS